MKIEIGVDQHDGFVRHVLFRIDGGLTLKSHHRSLPFAGQDARREIAQQLRDVVAQFEKDGHTVTGQQWLEEIE